MPTTHSSLTRPRLTLPAVDDSAEIELWAPFGQSPNGSTWDYPPTMAHSASCFLSMCRLSVIFNNILLHMYDPLMRNTEAEMEECFQTQEVALQQWWDQLAPYLRLDSGSLPVIAPPSHIVTLKYETEPPPPR